MTPRSSGGGGEEVARRAQLLVDLASAVPFKKGAMLASRPLRCVPARPALATMGWLRGEDQAQSTKVGEKDAAAGP